MKKIISSIVLIVMMFSSVLETYALNASMLDTGIYNTKLSSTYLSDLGKGVVKVKFQDITAKNAGMVVQSWKDTSTFPKRFMLDQGLSVKIDMNEVNKKLVKISTVKQNISTYTKAGIQVGTIQSELRMLPDRLQLFESIDLTYQNDDQIATIRHDLFGGSGVLSDLNTLTNKNLKPINSRGLSDAEFKKTGLDGLKAFPNTQAELDARATKALIAQCITENKLNAKTACTEEAVLQKLKKANKHITVQEKVEFLLIPPSTIGGDFDFAKKDPSEVRITKDQISGVFHNYAIVNGIINKIGPTIPAAVGSSDTTNPLNATDYCEKKYTQTPTTTTKKTVSGEVTASSRKAVDPSVNLKSLNSDKIAQCADLQTKKNTITTEVYSKDLLNGFTL